MNSTAGGLWCGRHRRDHVYRTANSVFYRSTADRECGTYICHACKAAGFGEVGDGTRVSSDLSNFYGATARSVDLQGRRIFSTRTLTPSKPFALPCSAQPSSRISVRRLPDAADTTSVAVILKALFVCAETHWRCGARRGEIVAQSMHAGTP